MFFKRKAPPEQAFRRIPAWTISLAYLQPKTFHTLPGTYLERDEAYQLMCEYVKVESIKWSGGSCHCDDNSAWIHVRGKGIVLHARLEAVSFS